MPLRVLEAQACGLPVVGSRIPGIIDIVEDDRNGKLIAVNDIRGFVIALKEYYMLWKEFPEKYYEMNKKIRERTIKQYDWEQVMDKIEELFIRILEN
jgi:glycosyltransferase involved in cell wall biosynthesis